jgi:hypothetical protein
MAECCPRSSAIQVGAWGSLDHLVGASKHRRRYREAEFFFGVEVNDHPELRWLLHGQVSGLGTVQKPIGYDRLR